MAPRWLSDQVTALRLSFMDSSLPGLKVICGFGSKTRRFAWFIVFCSLFALTIHDIVKLAVEFYKYPDSLNIKYEEPANGKQIDMPSITVCNLNPYTWTEFCANLDTFLQLTNSSTRADTMEQMQNISTTFCVDKKPKLDSRLSVWSLDKAYMDLMERFTEWSGIFQRKNALMVDKMSHKEEKMVSLIMFDNNTRDKLKNAGSEQRDGLNASSLNATIKYYPRYGRCFCYFCSTRVPVDNFDGPHNGLLLVLVADDNNYLPFIVEAGFLVAIHDQGVEVDFTKDGVFIQPLATTFIGVSQRVLGRLKEPYANPCRSDWPSYLKPYVSKDNSYTAFECRDFCIQYHIATKLKCLSFKYPTLLNYKLGDCNSTVNTDDIVTQTRNGSIDCRCKNVCLERGFDKITSSLSWHPKIQQKSLENTEESSKAKVYIYMQSNQINNRTKVPKMDLREFVSGIGSIMGMYLGYSFLFCWSILDVLGRAAWGTYRAYKKEKRLEKARVPNSYPRK